jgi:hypothetical protein
VLALAAAPATAAVVSSPVYAGYRATPAAGLTSASITFRVPKTGSCATTETRSAFLGLWQQSGAGMSHAVVRVECNHGVGVTDMETTVNGADPVGPVAVGDLVRATLSRKSTSQTATVADLTSGVTTTVTDIPVPASVPVQFGLIDYGEPLPSFGTASFSAAKENGVLLANLPRTRLNRVVNGTVTATASAVTAGTGVFSVTYQAR